MLYSLAMSAEKRIVIHLSRRDNTVVRMAEGIMRYAKTHPRWNILFRNFHPANDCLQDFGEWQPHGIIAESPFQMDDPEVRSPCLKAVVFVGRPVPEGFAKPYAELGTDNEAMGQMAAEFFIRKGLANFAYVGSLSTGFWDTERRDAFQKRLQKAGYRSEEYQTLRQCDYTEESKRLVKFLTGLPKPCGIFASFDQRAKHILDACHEANIAVPDQIQVRGADNEEWCCETTRPTLSSIDNNFQLGGYLAAERLDRLLDGRRFASPCIRYKPKCVIERASTSDHLGTSRSVVAALDFIRINALEQITVSDIAKASRTSLRMLQKNFAKVIGYGIADALRRERLDHARHLLETTETPIATITEYCRLGTEFNAKTLFRKHFGMTMSACRNQYRTK